VRVPALVRRGSLLRDRRGQSLTEFALTAPILLLLILAIIDFGRAWQTYQIITDAARLGTRTAVVDNGATEQDVRDAIDRHLVAASLPLAARTVTITGFGAPRPDLTTIRISYSYRLGLIGAFIAWTTGQETITLETEITMQNE
jgi:Flp pilus assembly protein TadG